MKKYRCLDCRKTWPEAEVLEGRNPFDKNIEIRACPACKAIDRLCRVCDAEGCTGVAVHSLRGEGQDLVACLRHVASKFASQ